MHRFLAGLRRVLAYTDLERMNLGSMAHNAIQEEFIPRLKKRLEVATTDNEKDMLERLIAEYEKYSDPRTPEANIYNKTAANVVRTLARRSSMNDEDMEDLTQQIALDFFQSRQEKGSVELRDTIKKFKEMQGPLALNSFWMRIIDLRTRFHIKMIQRHQQEKTLDPLKGDEGEERDSWSQVQAPSQVDESYVMQVIEDLKDFIHRKFVSSPEKKDLFDLWFESAQEKGFDKVDMKHDVYTALKDKGYGGSLTGSMPLWWNEVKRAIVQFFDRELEGTVSNQMRKMLKISSAEVVAYEVFRRRLAAWMLGGVLRGMVERE